MYLTELELKDTTAGNTSASFLDILQSIGKDGQLCAFVFDKRDDLIIKTTNFPF